ncbi:cytochrome c [Thioclava sp. A2]|uniref:c-type cytochrome n=1 Tax=Thioclava sp. FCG-A2 TaxID=3080562 RepID=UPI0029558A14|nr:cytochrome c [Thioclava sp. A2]MDV7270895.1 cytochrome c [Thioclava sp. A2]
MPERAFALALAVSVLTLPALAEEISPKRAEALAHLVEQDCGSCHGLTRKGGLGSPLTYEALEGRDRDSLALVILDGMPGTAMPPWRPLMTEAEAYWIADFLLKDPSK